MSDIALNLLDHLREGGMDSATARNIVESFDQRVEDAMRDVKAHSDRNRVETEEKVKANAEQIKAHEEKNKAQVESFRAQAESFKAREEQIRTEFVSAATYHERDKTLVTREEFRAENAAIRAEMARSREEFHAEMARSREEFRADMARSREEFRAEIADLRKEVNTGFQRLFIGGLIAFGGGFGAVIAGIATLAVKLYFGV